MVSKILLMLMALVAWLAASGAALADKLRPNIIFILIDDLRWDALGCTGQPVAQTPNIDRIGNEGAIFENAFVTTPLCSPSRASILTGQYVRTHGVNNNTRTQELNKLGHQLITFPMLLHKSGYDTAFIGKWHMGNDDSPRRGFDRWVSFPGQGVYFNPTLNIDGHRQKERGYISDILSDYAVNYIKAPHDRPFCLYLGHKAVHQPFTPAPRDAGLFEGRKIQRRPNANDPSTKLALTESHKREGGPTDKVILDQLRTMVAVDDGVGRIMRTLEQKNELDNTLIVFTSDNGFFWGEHGLTDKRYGYEESIRVPLLMRYPKMIKPGRKISEMALNIDLAPTFLDLGGAPIPREMEGRSLVPILQGRPVRWRDAFLGEYFKEDPYPFIPAWHGIRTERFKFLDYPALTGADEFYDLKNDPYEMRNLIDDPAAADDLKRTKAEMEDLSRKIADDKPMRSQQTQ